uniref:Cell division protein FTSH n=1 Tax=Bryopsis sp. HV04063 TaxID=1979421 RepID=A0A2P0QIS7_9CHLO|nr:cell division protein FTSH [Bryopsis sp. HV04063]ARO74069.1 cell division protein FTSH [Bryopsis sp. HV04063]
MIFFNNLLAFRKNRKASKIQLLKNYFWFLNLQKIFKKQLVLLESEIQNFYLIFSFCLIFSSVLNIFLNPLTFVWKTKTLYKNYPGQFFLNFEQPIREKFQLNKNFLSFKQITNIGIYETLLQKFYIRQYLFFNYYSNQHFYKLPIQIKINSNSKSELSGAQRDVLVKTIYLKKSFHYFNILTSKKLLFRNLFFKNKNFYFNILLKKSKFLFISPITKNQFLTNGTNEYLFLAKADFYIYKKFQKIQFYQFFINSFISWSHIKLDLLATNFLIDPNTFLKHFSEQFPEFQHPFKYYSIALKKRLIQKFEVEKLSTNFLFSKKQKLSFSNYLKKPNIYDFNTNLSSPKTYLYSSIEQFSDNREPLGHHSFLLFFQIGFLVFFYKIFQNLYKDFGKEILITFIDFIKIIGIIDDEEWLKDDLNLIQNQKAFRSIKKLNTHLRDIAGIEHLILEIGEIIWLCRSAKQMTFGESYLNKIFIKNQSLDAKSKIILQDLSSTLFRNSKAFLFIGPPGTGKTLLVQAIAGESEVPILVQSGSILKNPRQRGKGARTIQKIFQRARQIAPCIIFIDEVDGIGARRAHLSLNITGNYDLLELIDNQSFPFFSSFENPQTQSMETSDDIDSFENLNTLTDTQEKISLQVLQENEFENISRTEQLSLLTQLLIELDGLKPLNNIVVIGATNRFSILDPALLRPGRFNNFLYLSLPNTCKRINLFKLYSRRLGFNEDIVWSYFSKRTEGLSSADIAAIVNESAIHAISENEKHSVQSLELGIDRITTTPSRQNYFYVKKENYKFLNDYLNLYILFYKKDTTLKTCQKRKSKIYHLNHFLICKNLQLQLRNAYYTISQGIFSILFKNTPEICVLSFFTRKPNFRHSSTNRLISLLEAKFMARMEFETKLVYLLSGKAAELLPNSLAIFFDKNYKLATHKKLVYQLYEQSNFGSQDLKQATLLSKLMINKWYFYAEQIVTEKYHWIMRNFNAFELDIEEIRLYKAISEEMQSQIDNQNIFFNRAQKWSFRSWWQQLIQKKLNFVDRSVLNWYRIYLSDPEESEQNIEWVPPDDFYHIENINQINPYFFWNNFLLYTQDYLYHSLLLNGFNLSFRTIKNFSELLDLLADSLMRFLKLQDDQLIEIIKKFFEFQKLVQKMDSITHDISSSKNKHVFNPSKPQQKTVVVKGWGKYSRRKKSKKFFLSKLQKIAQKVYSD